MSLFVNALQTNTPSTHGEKGHLQYGWSNDIDEKIVQFFFQLVRTSDHSDLERQLHTILGNLKQMLSEKTLKSFASEGNNISKLTLMYKLIGQTRDIIAGKGEQQLAFMQIFIWYQYFPELALKAIDHCVLLNNEHPYGSWKDIKYLCNYVRDKTSDKKHPMIIYACNLLLYQLNKDWEVFSEKSPTDKTVTISLAARWTPREPNYKKKKNVKFGWIYNWLATHMFPEFIESASREDKIQWKAALTKCKIHLNKRVVTMNKYLDTTQIKQCNDQWRLINFNNVTTQTLRRQRSAFQNKTKRGLKRSYKNDREECAMNFTNHLEAAKVDPTRHKIHGKRCSTYELVKDALSIHQKTPSTQVDIDTINLQWEDNLKNNKGLEKFPIVPMIDTSGSMESDQCIPLFNAIGLGLRASELTHPAFKNQVLTFDHIPQWLNLEDCKDTWEKIHKIKSAAWGTSTQIYKAFKMVLDACMQKKVPAHEVENMIIAIFSDMQIDCNCICASPYNDKTLTEQIDTLYKNAGYKTPHLLFWNLRKTTGFPNISTKKNITALSGYSSALLNVFCDKGIETLKEITPRQMLEDLLNHDRYSILEKYIIEYDTTIPA